MAARPWTYSYANVSIVAGGITLQGVARNNTVRARRDAPKVTHQPGMPRGSRSIMLSNSGTVQIALIQASPSNKFFSDKYAIQEEGNDGDAFALRIYNNAGGELIRAECAWVTDMSEIALQEELTEVQWTIQCDSLYLRRPTDYQTI